MQTQKQLDLINTQPMSANDPSFIDAVGYESIIDFFNLILTTIADGTYSVMDGTDQYWMHTGYQDYHDAISAVIYELQERCMIPHGYNDEDENQVFDQFTDAFLQNEIKSHGELTAKAIMSIYDIINYLIRLKGNSVVMPSISHDKSKMIYYAKWDCAELAIDYFGNVYSVNDGKKLIVPLRDEVTKIAAQLR